MLAKQTLLIAAPSSGSGKTVLTLALLRAFKNKGVHIVSAKAGPDFIDPGFHGVASGKPSVNLDPWAMDEHRIQSLASNQQGSHLLVEAMMGLFDGAADGSGSAAELSKVLGSAVILVVDASKQSHSIAALVRGFRDHDKDVNVVGVILNKVGSARHEVMLRSALAMIEMPVLGVVGRSCLFDLPERHLGLVQAGETQSIEDFIEKAAEEIARTCDLDAIQGLFSPLKFISRQSQRIPPLGQHIAIARDEAFSFIYPHMLTDWQMQGSEISFFSPLNNEGPSEHADSVYLPGGYPELHAEKLSHANHFQKSMQNARARDALIYGECGGYMVLGEGIEDKNGKLHSMLGFLRFETSFAKRKLHLGYRKLTSKNFPLGRHFMAHEFHYTSAVREEGEALFEAEDAMGNALGRSGLRKAHVYGSYMHILGHRTEV